MNFLRSMLGVVLVFCCATAVAETFYKWTDKSGIVHFSDEPPPALGGVEERHLPAAPPSEAARGEQANVGAAEAQPVLTESATPPAEGPAHVVIIAHKSPRTSPSAMHVVGAVRNVGAAEAQNVTVTISAVDAIQGNPCLNQEAPVTPSTLHAGETGTFDVDVDSPCLFGDTHVEIAPLWE